MARPALRKIDPTLDLAGHLVTIEQITAGQRAAPRDVDALFARPAPLEIEVGTGKGMFLVAATGQRGDHNFLGCEIARSYARLAASRLVRAGRANGIVVQGDAARLFHEILPDACATAVHVYFPDPWWKQRHRKRRVLKAPFLADIERVLKPEASLHFWTDVREYFEATLDLIAQTTSLLGPLAVPEHPAEHEFDYRTHFERRTRLHQQPVYRAEFRRCAAAQR